MDNKKEVKKNNGILVCILVLLLIAAVGFICYDKLINKEKPPVNDNNKEETEVVDKITSLKRIIVTDTDQVINVGDKEYKIKREVSVDGAFLLIDNNIQVLKNNESIYADFAYATNKYIIFAVAAQDAESIVYAIDDEKKEITVNDGQYQIHDLIINEGKVYAKGHVFCGLDKECSDKDLIIKYENNIITVSEK